MYVKNKPLTLTQGDSAVAGRRVNVVALFCDLRGFSDWCERVDLNQVKLMRSQFERVIQICNDHHHDFHKFLGDGFVLVWEESDEVSLHTVLARALDAAFDLHKKYWYLQQEEMPDTPSGYGIGIAVGEAVLSQPETFLAESTKSISLVTRSTAPRACKPLPVRMGLCSAPPPSTWRTALRPPCSTRTSPRSVACCCHPTPALWTRRRT